MKPKNLKALDMRHVLIKSLEKHYNETNSIKIISKSDVHFHTVMWLINARDNCDKSNEIYLTILYLFETLSRNSCVCVWIFNLFLFTCMWNCFWQCISVEFLLWFNFHKNKGSIYELCKDKNVRASERTENWIKMTRGCATWKFAF